HTDTTAVFFNLCPKFFQRQFSVVACPRWFRYACRAFRKQTRQQHSRLHLGAGHRHLVVDGLQFLATNLQGREIIFPPPNVRSHPRTSAPISLSGAITRFMGRFCSDSSPVSFEEKVCPARIPASNRIVVPEFPASRARQLLFRPRTSRPVTRAVSFSTFTPAP